MSTQEEIAQAKEELQEMSNLITQGCGFCPQCGITAIDEDGTCLTCGNGAEGQALLDLSRTINHALQACACP